ncbi:MAG: tetratricopeptide repeat protein [Roseovarius sp.]
MPTHAQEITLEDLTARAKTGDVAAQLSLARLYHQGESVTQNYASAATWAARAAEAGNPEAQNLLGRYYHAGLGVTQSQSEALRWLEAAASTGGDPQYIHDLGLVLENGADGSSDPGAAARAYAQAAEAGHMDATVSLGMLYQEGKGVVQDFTRALDLYESAAAQGHPRAQNNLGLLYVRGSGVPQDYEKAAQLFAAAAETGLPGALRNLGVMYENGFGVPVDEALAADLYRQAGQGGPAAENTPALRYDPRLQPVAEGDDAIALLRQSAAAGDPVAQFQLGWHLIQTAGADPAANTHAAALFQAAAQVGHGPAMRNLGLLYFEGRGVPQDYMLGRMWLTLAGQSGQQDAALLIEALAAKMTTGQINEAQARAKARNK